MSDDNVNHPAHYVGHPSGIECIQITRWMGFNLGNAIKYIWRADLKGRSVEDLQKAVWYLNDEIAKRLREKDDEMCKVQGDRCYPLSKTRRQEGVP